MCCMDLQHPTNCAQTESTTGGSLCAVVTILSYASAWVHQMKRHGVGQPRLLRGSKHAGVLINALMPISKPPRRPFLPPSSPCLPRRRIHAPPPPR